MLSLFLSQSAVPFQVSLLDENLLLIRLEADDVAQNASVYAVRVSGEAQTHTLLFSRASEDQTLPQPLMFNASYHGLCYTIYLMLDNSSKPAKTISVLTGKKTSVCVCVSSTSPLDASDTVCVCSEPFPLDAVHVSDYAAAPETAVVFHITSPERNIYTRVNISYTEAHHQHYMLYKGTPDAVMTSLTHRHSCDLNLRSCFCVCLDFSKGKTVFRHWLSGTCYSNITFQLISEVTVNRTTLMKRSDVTHRPLHHRMGTTRIIIIIISRLIDFCSFRSA